MNDLGTMYAQQDCRQTRRKVPKSTCMTALFTCSGNNKNVKKGFLAGKFYDNAPLLIEAIFSS